MLSFKYNLSFSEAQKSLSVKRSLCLNGSVRRVSWTGCHNDILVGQKIYAVYRSLIAEDSTFLILGSGTLSSTMSVDFCEFLLVFSLTS